MIPVKVANYKGVVEFNNKVSSKVYHTRIRVISPDSIQFLGGQFASIKVAGNIRRSYSISSSPLETKFFETYVDITPMGPGATFFANAVPGTEVEFLAPLGRFLFKGTEVVEGSSNVPAIFLATGTGITPFISMFEEQLKINKNTRPMYLYWGLRHEEDVFLIAELDRLQSEYGNFKYKLAMSKPKGEWNGFIGYCSDNLMLDWDSIPGAAMADFYMCGSGNMLASTEAKLLGKGVDKAQINYEKFY